VGLYYSYFNCDGFGSTCINAVIIVVVVVVVVVEIVVVIVFVVVVVVISFLIYWLMRVPNTLSSSQKIYIRQV